MPIGQNKGRIIWQNATTLKLLSFLPIAYLAFISIKFAIHCLRQLLARCVSAWPKMMKLLEATQYLGSK